jgi:hypothetical protein
MLRSFAPIIGLCLTLSCELFQTPVQDPANVGSEPEEDPTQAAPKKKRAWIQGDAYPAEKSAKEYRSDSEWKTRVAFLYPKTGNRIGSSVQASMSHFRHRRSRFTEDGRTTYAELLVSGRSADFDEILRAKGLTATFLGAAPDDPGEQNTIVEVCTYLDEKPQELEMGPLEMKIETVYYVRTILPDAVARFSTGPIQVKKAVSKGSFSSWDLERYEVALMNAQSAAQVKLVDWLVKHLKE